mmetsp:Transcript_39695/g.84858  ORF Transcript_39695/g.84858 Transcript_39695/m.84858 type:complete len:580 (-) Transcript_39695:71-1810(-)
MPRLPRIIVAGALLPTVAALEVIFAADIGHPRQDAHDLTSPWPLDKSAWEGAFSLYEGLEDYIKRQGARPDALLVAGDVAYSGGAASVLNATSRAFERIFAGTPAEGKIFPSIGNHDVSFLGCTMAETRPYSAPCYYGQKYSIMRKSQEDLTYKQWQGNWQKYFPALNHHASSPKNLDSTFQWETPTRYTLDLEKKSSVHIIVGLDSGSWTLSRTEDTPESALETSTKEGVNPHCSFLRDSLEQGKRLGKTVFIYVTHNFAGSCDDWSLLQQVDVWIAGHRHAYWQNMEPGATLVQEQQHYPARIIVGNGGFDEGHIDVVSFVHMKEEVYEKNGVERVSLKFLVKDTCIGDETCPTSIWPNAHCWQKCKDMPGGVDHGGGPRKATDSKYGYGFTFDAMKEQVLVRRANRAVKLQLGTNSSKLRWVTLGKGAGHTVIIPTDDESKATVFTFYDGHVDGLTSTARLASWSKGHGPVSLASDSRTLFVEGNYWKADVKGKADVNLASGEVLKFMRDSEGHLVMLEVTWELDLDMGLQEQLIAAEGKALFLKKHEVLPPSEELVVLREESNDESELVAANVVI